MVHLVIKISQNHPQLHFRIIQVDQFPTWAQSAGVVSTPSLLIAGQPLHAGNLSPTQLAFYLWLAATPPSS